jgi:TIR domain/YARHG domain
MPFDAFISYSHNDKLIADALCATVEAAGIRCWIAPRNIRPGADWSAGIAGGIDQCRVLVLILSSHSNGSRQVHREVARAFNSGLTIVPIRVEEVEPDRGLAFNIEGFHWLDALTEPRERYFRDLANHLRAILDTRPSPPPQEPVAPVPRHTIPLWQRIRRSPALTGTAIAAVLLLLGAVISILAWSLWPTACPAVPPAPLGGFLFPDSDKRQLTPDELRGLSCTELRIARNEIYARHGRPFRDPWLRCYFRQTHQYHASPSNWNPQGVEASNISLIVQTEVSNRCQR